MATTDYFEISQVVFHMLGAADYFDENPDQATDARLAAAFRSHIAQARAVLEVREEHQA